MWVEACCKFIFQIITFDFQMDVTVYYKYFVGSFRQISKVLKIDVCAVVENIEKYPLFKDITMLYNATYPGLVHKCPYTVC